MNPVWLRQKSSEASNVNDVNETFAQGRKQNNGQEEENAVSALESKLSSSYQPNPNSNSTNNGIRGRAVVKRYMTARSCVVWKYCRVRPKTARLLHKGRTRIIGAIFRIGAGATWSEPLGSIVKVERRTERKRLRQCLELFSKFKARLNFERGERTR